MLRTDRSNISSEIGLSYGQSHIVARNEGPLGGDFCDVFHPMPGLTSIVIGDISGNGSSFSHMALEIGKTLRMLAYKDPSPSHVMTNLNNKLYRETSHDEFISLFYGLFNKKDNKLVFANAGHELPLYSPNPGSSVQEITDHSVLLGVLQNTSYLEHGMKLSSGDRLFLYTDGVINAGHGDYATSLESLKTSILNSMHIAPADLAIRLIAKVKRGSGDQVRDDASVLVVCVE